MNEAIREQLSAYVDGELPANEAELLIRRVTQDSELRQEVAEFLAIGRVIRGEAGVAAADRLHERVAAELGERRESDGDSTDSVPASKTLKPLAGIAIAASVALVGVFALQSTSVDSEQAVVPAVAAETTVPIVTTQQQTQRELLLKHANASSDLGANGMGPRLVTFEFDEELDDDAAEDEAATQESIDQP